MHNFKCNYDVVNAYLNQDDLTIYHNLDIYDVGIDAPESMFTAPNVEFIDDVEKLLSKVYQMMNSFSLNNEDKFHKFLPDAKDVEKRFVINFVVGLPHQIKKFFKGSPDGHIDIIIDLHNYITSYNGFIDDNAIDILIEDIYDYVCYVICLLILDSHEDTTETDAVAILYHAIYSAAYAYYISDSKHLDYMRQTSVYEMWLYLEYDILKKIKKNNKKAIASSTEYLHTVIQINPEMIVLGIAGKVYLENMNEDEAYELFKQGPYDFIDKVETSKKISKSNGLTIANLILTSLIPLVVISLVIIGIIDLVNQRVSLALKIIPLISFILVLFRDIIKYFLKQTSKYRFYIFGLFIILISIIYAYFIFF